MCQLISDSHRGVMVVPVPEWHLQPATPSRVGPGMAEQDRGAGRASTRLHPLGALGWGRAGRAASPGTLPAPRPEQQEPLGSHLYSTSVEQEGEQM